MRSAPCEKGLKTGMSRYTLSSEKEETEAMLPVEKKALCNKKRKKTAMRKSERASGRYCCFPFPSLGSASCEEMEDITSDAGFGDGRGDVGEASW